MQNVNSEHTNKLQNLPLRTKSLQSLLAGRPALLWACAVNQRKWQKRKQKAKELSLATLTLMPSPNSSRARTASFTCIIQEPLRCTSRRLTQIRSETSYNQKWLRAWDKLLESKRSVSSSRKSVPKASPELIGLFANCPRPFLRWFATS